MKRMYDEKEIIDIANDNIELYIIELKATWTNANNKSVNGIVRFLSKKGIDSTLTLENKFLRLYNYLGTAGSDKTAWPVSINGIGYYTVEVEGEDDVTYTVYLYDFDAETIMGNKYMTLIGTYMTDNGWAENDVEFAFVINQTTKYNITCNRIK